MTWTRHRAVISVLAVLVLAALVAGAVLALRDSGGRARIASGTRTPERQLLSPFTGEPVNGPAVAARTLRLAEPDLRP